MPAFSLTVDRDQVIGVHQLGRYRANGNSERTRALRRSKTYGQRMRAAAAHTEHAELAPTKCISNGERVIGHRNDRPVPMHARLTVSGTVKREHVCVEALIQPWVRTPIKPRPRRPVEAEERSSIWIAPGRPPYDAAIRSLNGSLLEHREESSTSSARQRRTLRRPGAGGFMHAVGACERAQNARTEGGLERSQSRVGHVKRTRDLLRGSLVLIHLLAKDVCRP